MENTATAGAQPGRPGEHDGSPREKEIQHLRQAVRETRTRPGECLHNRRPACVGTGTKDDGSRCIHGTPLHLPEMRPEMMG